MKQYNNPFIWLSILFLGIGGVILLFIDKGDLVLWLNLRHSPSLDYMMSYWTFLGDGFMLLALLIAMLFYRFYYAILTIVLSLNILVFSQGLKRTVFSGWERPTAYFDESVEWNTVEGVQIATSNTFPSGHTITGFAILFFLSMIINRKWFYHMAFVLAVGVGISRVYLLQHFFVDIYFGAFLGIIATIVSPIIINLIFSKDQMTRWKSSSLLRRANL